MRHTGRSSGSGSRQLCLAGIMPIECLVLPMPHVTPIVAPKLNAVKAQAGLPIAQSWLAASTKHRYKVAAAQFRLNEADLN